MLQQGFGEVGIDVQVREGRLRLDHPELGQMPAGVRILGTERRSERVDLREGQAVGLDIQLPGDGEKRLAPEEILGEIRVARRVTREACQVQSADTEELAGTLGVGRGDDRRVDPKVAVRVEELVHGPGEAVAHPSDCSERVGPWPQVGHLPEKLEAVSLGRDRIRVRIIDPAFHANPGRLEFHRLASPARLDENASCGHGAAAAEVQDLARVVR